jgi:hypothetical protein
MADIGAPAVFQDLAATPGVEIRFKRPGVPCAHHKASIGQTYMLTQKRLESAFLCIIQTFVERLGGIREFFKLDRDCFQLDRIRLELFSPFS